VQCPIGIALFLGFNYIIFCTFLGTCKYCCGYIRVIWGLIKVLLQTTSVTSTYVGDLASAYVTHTERLANGTANAQSHEGFIFSTSGLTKKFFEKIKIIFTNELDFDMGGSWIA
jgi:hypothetical protein